MLSVLKHVPPSFVGVKPSSMVMEGDEKIRVRVSCERWRR